MVTRESQFEHVGIAEETIDATGKPCHVELNRKLMSYNVCALFDQDEADVDDMQGRAAVLRSQLRDAVRIVGLQEARGNQSARAADFSWHFLTGADEGGN